VFFSHAPVASTGGPARGSFTGTGVQPRARRTNCGAPPAPTRSTLSSQRATTSRSCTSSASAMPASRASASSFAMTSGSPRGLALVITSSRSCASSSHALPAGRPAASWNRRNWIGVHGSIVPSTSSPGATPASASAAPGRIGSSTIGRSRDCRRASSAEPASTQRTADATFAAITANGFSSRSLRARRHATAAALRASHARWNPPRPLTATIRPAFRSASAAAIGSPGSARPHPSTSASAGPHVGQAFGSAWKRRLAGSVYSRSQSGHCGNAAMLVCARSYGSRRVSV
jgi:hypothetical protein